MMRENKEKTHIGREGEQKKAKRKDREEQRERHKRCLEESVKRNVREIKR